MQAPGNPLSYNRYAYVFNNPLSHTDPSGYISVPQYATDFDNPHESFNHFDWRWHEMFQHGYGRGGGGGGLFGSGFGYGLPGVGGNGSGLNGVYFDWVSGTFRFSDNPSVIVGRSQVNLLIRPYLTDVAAVIFFGPRSNPFQTLRGFHFSDGTEFYFGRGNRLGGYLAQGQGAGKSGFDIDKAVNHLNENALPGFGKGACSPYVPNAINAGFGDNRIPTNLAGSAYGPILSNAGFTHLSVKSLEDYSPEKGDIAVMNGPPGGKTCNTGIGGICGHIQMYNGEKWVSDFFQTRPFWPGPGYDKDKPAFQIFRWQAIIF